MARVIRDIGEMQRLAESVRLSGKRIGVVPTMGSLHDGHLSLIRAARSQSDCVITTVFVNPSQFGPNEDFQRYPRNLERDIDLTTGAGTDVVFAPDASMVYPEAFRTSIEVDKITTVLEGRFRPGHFRGVVTIVAKLFNMTKPHLAVFGQKDAQQVVVVRRMMRDLNFDIGLVLVPTVREQDGLAMSSRNVYLTPEQRKEAPALYRALRHAEERVKGGEKDCAVLVAEMKQILSTNTSAVIDYVSIADGESLAELKTLERNPSALVSLAVRFGTTRLIDNIPLCGDPK